MFRRKARSALLIDFDNIISPVGMKDFIDSIENWLAWLEDGKFDKARRTREFMDKRVYWNLQFDQFKVRFEPLGFTTLACRSVVRSKKSSADMIIALDALESAFGNRKIDEYILFTTDTDFVPLLERLGDRNKDTVVTVIEGAVSEREYARRADNVITISDLKAACSYQRPRKLIERVYERSRAASKSVAKGSRAAVRATSQRVRGALRGLRRLGRRRPGDLVIAGNLVSELAQSAPGSLLGRRTVIRWLAERMPQFTIDGPTRFLGCSAYPEMIERIVAGRSDLQLHRHPNGGIAIMVPGKAEAA